MFRPLKEQQQFAVQQNTPTQTPSVETAAVETLARERARQKRQHIERFEPWPVLREPATTRALHEIMLVAIVVLFSIMMWGFWRPATQGYDQNGYIVGGRMIHKHLTSAFTPIDPDTGQPDCFQFVAPMWVGAHLGTPEERYYPKYPIGYPAMVAGALWLGDGTPNMGGVYAFIINPAAVTISIIAVFYLCRQFAGGYMALLGTLIFATNPTVLALAHTPSSHATNIMCITWGMALLVHWWRRGGMIHACLAGLLIGFAPTIRYSDGLLVLPIALAALLRQPFFSRQRWLETMGLIAWWAIPVTTLAIFNLRGMDTLTGYDPTAESSSSAFTWNHFFGDAHYAGNWENALRQLNANSLTFILGLGLVGIMLMYVWRWRLALLLTSWFVPTTILYMMYYWAPWNDENRAATSYMRFFSGMFVPFIVGAVWAIKMVVDVLVRGQWWHPSRIFAPLTVGVMVALCCVTNMQLSWQSMESGMHRSTFLRRVSAEIAGRGIVPPGIPEGSVVFADRGICHNVQFWGDYRLYEPAGFDANSTLRWVFKDEDEAETHHIERYKNIANHVFLGDWGRWTLSDAEIEMLECGADTDTRKQFTKADSGVYNTARYKFSRVLAEEQQRIIFNTINREGGVYFVMQLPDRPPDRMMRDIEGRMPRFLRGMPRNRFRDSYYGKTYELTIVRKWDNAAHRPVYPKLGPADRRARLRTKDSPRWKPDTARYVVVKMHRPIPEVAEPDEDDTPKKEKAAKDSRRLALQAAE